MLKLTTDKHEASRGLSATAKLLVYYAVKIGCRSALHFEGYFRNTVYKKLSYR